MLIVDYINGNIQLWLALIAVIYRHDLLKRGRARRKLNAESDAASDVEKAGEVDDEGEEVDEDGEKSTPWDTNSPNLPSLL